jgi:hypothetical protein
LAFIYERNNKKRGHHWSESVHWKFDDDKNEMINEDTDNLVYRLG